MKITLKAHIEAHREIAKMFVGCKDIEGDGLVGYCEVSDKFVFDIGCTEYYVTIDTESAEMDLRLAIGTDIEFEVYDPIINQNYTTKIESGNKFEEIHRNVNRWEFKIQLSKDYLNRIEVSYED